jgi:hypothetical protein
LADARENDKSNLGSWFGILDRDLARTGNIRAGRHTWDRCRRGTEPYVMKASPYRWYPTLQIGVSYRF